MRIIVFKEISFISFFLFIFFRLINFKIFYLNISGNSFFKNKKIIYLLSKFNFIWFNYIDFNLNNVLLAQLKIANNFADSLSKEITKKFWCKELEDTFIKKAYLDGCINSNIWFAARQSVELLCVAKFLKKKYNSEIYIFSANNIIHKKINHVYYNFKNLNFFPKLYIFEIVNFLIKVILKKFLNFFFLKLKNYTKKDSENIKKISQYEIAFVPHQGINYNNLFIKDFYYNKRKKSNFTAQNILHIETESEKYLSQSKNFYLKNNINNITVNQIISYKNVLFKFLFFFIKKIKIILKITKYDFEISFYYLKSIYLIFKYEELISKLDLLKLLLVGHDVLFPLEFSVVCKKRNIKTIAIQDRIISAYWTKLMIFDFYFISSPAAYRLIKKRMFPKFINKLIKIHPIKVEKFIHFKDKPTVIDKNKIRCLVMDRHSDMDWYLGYRSPYNNWRINKRFYELIISLSQIFPDVQFYIKSKDYSWLKVNYFKEIINKLKKRGNIKILNNNTLWNHSLLLNKFNLFFGMHNSLADEILFLGKPVILFNEDRYPGDVFPFSKILLADSLDEICKKINLIIKNDKGYSLKLNKIKKKIFFNRKFPPFLSILNSIFSKL